MPPRWPSTRNCVHRGNGQKTEGYLFPFGAEVGAKRRPLSLSHGI